MEDIESDVVKAPWSDSFVQKLKAWQLQDGVHPYTCIRHRDGKHPLESKLTPTTLGFICHSCDYTQDWALDLDLPRFW
jgi:hypothetical protein